MSVTRFEAMEYLHQAHSKRRWENQEAEHFSLRDLGSTVPVRFPPVRTAAGALPGQGKTKFLDQKMIRGPAFKLLEEAELFCQRHLPLPGEIIPERLQRYRITPAGLAVLESGRP